MEGGSLLAQQPRELQHPVLTLFPDVEWMPIHTRACVGTLIGYVYSLGQFLLAGVAYAVPHWRHLQLLVSVPFFAFFIYSWCVGPRVGHGCHRSPEGCKGQDISQSSAHIPSHKWREGQTQYNASVCMIGKQGCGEKALPQDIQFSGFPHSVSLPALLPLPATKS